MPLSDAQWTAVQTVLPKPAGRGRPRSLNYRALIDAILEHVETERALRSLTGPVKFGTVHAAESNWMKSGLLDIIFKAMGRPDLSQKAREKLYSAR